MQKEVIDVLKQIAEKHDNINLTIDENPSQEKIDRINKIKNQYKSIDLTNLVPNEIFYTKNGIEVKRYNLKN